ncbi:MAG: hypothetical protein K8F60_03785 [Melioribacteraceae bacterium]|nr:hypothetical protein [Melioribacteraceae bacterium]
MAIRPLFIPQLNSKLFDEVEIEFKWIPGQAFSRKQLCVESLHKSAKEQGFNSILEISSKSLLKLGNDLSAFNLQIKVSEEITTSVESLYQSSKVFENGGPYKDIADLEPRKARKDERLFNSGRLIGFRFNETNWNLETDSSFYDFLYINALEQNKDLSSKLIEFDGFTDIEFNPQKQISCQARTAAIYLSLVKQNLLKQGISSKENFVNLRKGNLVTKQLDLF